MDTAHVGNSHLKVGFAACDGAVPVRPQRMGIARAKEYLPSGDPSCISITRQVVKVPPGQHASTVMEAPLFLQTRAGGDAGHREAIVALHENR